VSGIALGSGGLRSFVKRSLPTGVKRVLRAIAFQILDLSWQLPSGVRIRIRNLSDWAIYNEIFVAGDYDPAILMALDSAKENGGMHIVDLGANVGFFTLRCIEMVRRHRFHASRMRVTAIEGNPNTYSQLLERVGMQSDLPEFVAINGLVGERRGTDAISDLEHSGLNHISSDKAGRGIMVDYVDVEGAVGSGRVSLLKCDIEGAELAFLQSYPALLARTDIAILELHPQQCDEQQCISLLRSAGLLTHERLAQNPDVTSVIMASRPTE